MTTKSETYTAFSHGVRVCAPERMNGDKSDEDQPLTYGTVIDGPFSGPGETSYWLVKWDGSHYRQYVFESEMRALSTPAPREGTVSRG